MRSMVCALILGLFLATAVPAAEPVKVNNKICPVSGQKVGEMGVPYKVQYNGKQYNLCCFGCVKEFRKSPEKFVEAVEEEMQSEAADEQTP